MHDWAITSSSSYWSSSSSSSSSLSLILNDICRLIKEYTFFHQIDYRSLFWCSQSCSKLFTYFKHKTGWLVAPAISQSLSIQFNWNRKAQKKPVWLKGARNSSEQEKTLKWKRDEKKWSEWIVRRHKFYITNRFDWLGCHISRQSLCRIHDDSANATKQREHVNGKDK